MANEIPQRIATTLEQLGGRAIFAMAFKSCTYSDAEVTLKIAPALVCCVPGKADHVTVRLEADDTYTVLVLRAVKLNRRTFEYTDTVTVAEREQVYAEDLRQVVESLTGLRLTLGTMGRS